MKENQVLQAPPSPPAPLPSNPSSARAPKTDSSGEGSSHGGDLRWLAERAGLPQDQILDFSASINPLGPPEGLRAVISGSLDRIVHYPDPESTALVAALSQRWGIAADQLVLGNGSSEILFAIARALDYRRAIVPVPSYVDYAEAIRRAGRPVQLLPLPAEQEFALDWDVLEEQLEGRELVILGQPNNPTGRPFDAEAFQALAARHAHTWFVVDEAFADFMEGYASLATAGLSNVIVVRSFTKFYAIPGLRLGYAVAGPALAGTIRQQIAPWSINTLVQEAGVWLLEQDAYAARSVELVRDQRVRFTQRLRGLPGLHVYESATNFLLVRLLRGDLRAGDLAQRLLADGLAIRTFGPHQHLDGSFFRVAVRLPEENDRLCRAVGEVLGVPQPGPRRPTPALMIQGTASNAGKSVLTAALCRILLQDGVRVAPFKAQNMSLNSFVTRDGGEMGRAQVVQAQACRLEPDVRMNPILLKPNSDTGSQVIVRGRPVGNYRVGEYVRYKSQAVGVVRACYDSLAAEFDVLLLEGAGSPGEVNLKAHDLVNMRMAQYAQAPVLIAGDIDRGGVFASFVGTMEVLEPWERRLVAGWIVNRFRGDASLLAPALEYTLRHTGRPVLGVVPFLPALNLPQEDSVEFKAGPQEHGPTAAEAVDVAVIDLPHISNFTDFDPFRVEHDVRIRVVRAVDALQQPDAVLIAGSKNTLADLQYLRTSGLAERIRALAAAGTTEVVGICAGFQMLGAEIRDPLGLESGDGAAAGLGLLPVRTVLAAEKTLLRTAARHTPSGLDVSGYEIHHGQTETAGARPIFTRPDGQVVGVAAGDDRVWGTYLHGVFDADDFRRWFVDRLRACKGLPPLGRIVNRFDIEPALDRLADVVRKSLDMQAVYRLLGI